MKELAQKIKGYQEQIASLNSKCKMLAVKAKHATMLLTVSDVEGLHEGLQEMDEEKSRKSSAQAIMVRQHKKAVCIVGDNIAWHCLIKKTLLTHSTISGFSLNSSNKLFSFNFTN